MSYSMIGADQAEVQQRSVISQAYLWMTVGLAITGAVAALIFSSPSMQNLIYALNGLTLSAIFLKYTKSSLASTFFITAGTFAVMGFYGYTTKRDLTRIGNLALMALIGVILASVVNFFLHNGVVYWITTYVGILIFVALIAYDTQKLKRLNAASGGDTAGRLSILGALMLYLDFINLFLFLLRIFGRAND